MATKDIMRKLNNLDYSDAQVERLREYLEKGTLPYGLNTRQQKKFIDNYKDFAIVEGKVAYEPKGLIVVPESKKKEVLQKLYDSAQGLGAGIKSFYARVAFQYLGITKKDTTEFLKNQTPYQLQMKPSKVTNSPIVAKYCNHIWSADLIDVSQYAGHNKRRRYILTVIDHFSRFCFAVGLVNKTPESIEKGFEEIHKEQSKVYPDRLITDNGGEFVNETFEKFCKLHHITHVRTLSHTPTNNALVENFNLWLRRLMRDLFIKMNDLNWIDSLPQLLFARNTTINTVTKKAPIDIYKHSKDKKLDEVEETVKEKLENKASHAVARVKNTELQVGDTVRLSLASIDPKIRENIKKGNQKLIVVRFSTELYKVKHIIKPATVFSRKKYVIEDEDGEVVKVGNKIGKFFASDLQKVGDMPDYYVDVEKMNKALL